ncbi:DUF6296 family protein [Streptomyces sp. NPDC089919]|uniref:DUF6296 family protein n=1 Tax=Streptomyces sp. NPDC089919 TaxID=3155188 RepID=UPI0034375269
MSKAAEGTPPSDPSPVRPPLLQNQGGTADDHGRPPGVPSRTGTGTSSAPSDPARVEEANAPAGPPQRYELVFSGGTDAGEDRVEVSRISRTGPGGHPVYEDATGIVQAEISDQAEVRILPTGGGQDAVRVVTARPLA